MLRWASPRCSLKAITSAREFLRTTFLWSCFWLNEREVARRPWLHRKSYVKIDQLLREEVPGALFAHWHRKLESEYAACLAALTPGAAKPPRR